MPRYVILFHELPAEHARASHWDLMLEAGDSLRTWAIEREPAPGLACDAEPLADHRLAYLDYEGPISGQRGSVTRWDEGDYRCEQDTTDALKVVLHGRRLACRVELARNGAGGHSWRVSFSTEPTSG